MAADSESQIGAGFEAMAAGDWSGARDAFISVLDVAEVPEALLGLATACWWLGDLPGVIESFERAYAAARRRSDPTFAAAAALSLSGYQKQFLGNLAAARGWLAHATRIVETEAPHLRGELLGGTRSSLTIRWRVSGWRGRRWRSDALLVGHGTAAARSNH